MKLIDRIELATQFLRRHWPITPRAGLILGTGLGKLAGHIQVDAAYPFAEVPEFSCSTALSHAGRLLCGRLAGVPIIAMEGRCHLYEGHSWSDITLPVQVMHQLGAKLLIVSNASGGVNPLLSPGEIVAVVDHIDLMRTRDGSSRTTKSPSNERQPTPRWTSPYDERLAEQALMVARREGFAARRGVYAGFTGPNFETRSEYRFLRRIGADVVGMSTVPEVIVAASLNLRVLALSVVTNVARPDALTKTTGEEVVAIATNAEPRLRAIVVDAMQTLLLTEQRIESPSPPAPLPKAERGKQV